FDGDGTLDLAVANSASGTVSIRLGNGAGGFTNAPDVAVGSFPATVAVGDLNGDGKPDLAVANFKSNTGSIRLGPGDGTFTTGPCRTVPDVSVGSGPPAGAVEDFDGDGKLALPVANALSNPLSIRRGTGTGAFPAAPDVPAGDLPESVAVGDLNGDGKLDLAA